MGVPSPLSGKMPTHSVSFQPEVAMRSSRALIATAASTSSRSAMRTFFHMRGGHRRLARGPCQGCSRVADQGPVLKEPPRVAVRLKNVRIALLLLALAAVAI